MPAPKRLPCGRCLRGGGAGLPRERSETSGPFAGHGAGPLHHAAGAISATTGAWSLGRSFLRGSLSITQAVTRGFKASLTRM